MNWFFSDQFLFPGNFYKHFLLANFFWKFNQGERCCISIYRSESKLIEVDQVVCFLFIYKQLWINFFSDQFFFPANFCKHLIANWRSGKVGTNCCRLWISTLKFIFFLKSHSLMKSLQQLMLLWLKWLRKNGRKLPNAE